MSGSPLSWYARRLSKMSPREMAWRLGDGARQYRWRTRQVSLGGAEAQTRVPVVPAGQPTFDSVLPAAAAELVPEGAAPSILAAADRIMEGEWEVLGFVREDSAAPDWFFDPVTGARAPQADYCFSIRYRSDSVTGNIKQVWELSRFQHVTLLACAYGVSGIESYAETAAAQLRSWWDENPFLSGVHWTSGIEIGLRLISWVWTRRLLDGWRSAAELFEANDTALFQIRCHQQYLSAFRSHGSSANNHVIAEAAGQLVAALAFPWFAESEAWADQAAGLLRDELANNTFPSGVNREMAFEYHGFVAELGLIAVVEAERAGKPLGDGTKDLLCRMLDVIAAAMDERNRAPRYGDGDDGRGFLLGPPGDNRWLSLLAIGQRVFGAPDWWPVCPPDTASSMVVSLAGGRGRGVRERPDERPSWFPDSGIAILRTPADDGPEIWCRCDGGPHGFLSIAAHAHADALSVEVRHGGVDVLADPGTYCYHGNPRWRSYFRSTCAHNTVEIAARDQSESAGPFLWTRHARTAMVGPGPASTSWCGEHDGYAGLDPPVRHRRSVRLVGSSRRLEILDELQTRGAHPLRIFYHLGPAVHADLHGDRATLSWSSVDGSATTATLHLADGVAWSLTRGSVDPPLGWYSSGFGRKEPSTTLVGAGRCGEREAYLTLLVFDD